MMENYFTESGEATFFQLSASKFISENHFTESAENHFSLKNCLVELLLDSVDNQL